MIRLLECFLLKLIFRRNTDFIVASILSRVQEVLGPCYVWSVVILQKTMIFSVYEGRGRVEENKARYVVVCQASVILGEQ